MYYVPYAFMYSWKFANTFEIILFLISSILMLLHLCGLFFPVPFPYLGDPLKEARTQSKVVLSSVQSVIKLSVGMC